MNVFVKFGARNIMSLAIVCDDLMPLCGHTRSEFIYNDLNAAFTRRNALMTYHCDINHHRSPLSDSECRNRATNVMQGRGLHSLTTSQTDVTAVIGSFCNRSTCGRHASPVLSLQMNPELVFFKRNANRAETAKPRSLASKVDFGIPLRHIQSPPSTLGCILHRFSMNALLAHSKTVFEI